MLAPVEDVSEDDLEPGGASDQGSHTGSGVAGSLGHGQERITAHRLLGPDREAALADGCAPLLATALDGPVTSALAADRAAYYINLLYAMWLMRRGHELEPRHEDLYARVLAPQRLVGGDYVPDEYAHDLAMLEQWGAVIRIAEARRIRGYKDNRRAQYRYRITDDAVAMLEWLEARLAARLQGRVRDSRDRLADLVGFLKEARRVLDGWRKGRRGADDARRAYYLLEAVAEAIAGISEELLGFRAEMIAFSQQPYDAAALLEILGWLERYVVVHLARVGELRAEIRDRLRELAAPRYRRALAECKAVVDDEIAAAPRFLRQSGPLRSAAELLAGAEQFFCHGGRLASLCRHIEESARGVVVKMHRHIKELERRNARLDDVRGAIAVLAERADRDPRYGELLSRVVASAHGRFERRPGFADHRAAPPAPRCKTASTRERARSPLAAKRATPAEARALRAKKLAELRVWLGERVLAGRPEILVSAAQLDDPSDPRMWIDVEHARRLGGGRTGRGLGVTITDVAGRALIEAPGCGLDAPDARVVRIEEKS